MALVFFIIVILTCIILGFFVLVQNPKGGGLSGTFGGMNNQLMGVKQTTDVLEKGTWIFAAVIGALCIVSILFLNGATNTNDNKLLKDLPTTAPAAAGQSTAPVGVMPSVADTNKK